MKYILGTRESCHTLKADKKIPKYYLDAAMELHSGFNLIQEQHQQREKEKSYLCRKIQN